MNKKRVLAALNSALTNSKQTYLDEMEKVKRARAMIRDDVSDMMATMKEPDCNKDSSFNFSSFHDLDRIIEGAVSGLTRPFTEDSILSIEGKTTEADSVAGVVESLLNQQWNRNHIPNDIINDISRAAMADGTAILNVGWKDNGGRVSLVAIEDIIPDHTAQTTDEVKFYIRRKIVTKGVILDNPGYYGKHTLKDLEKLTAYTGTSDYDIDTVVVYSEEETLRERVETFTLFGEVIVEGKVKDLMATWTDSYLLVARDNPYDSLPFVFVPYTRKPFSIYGEGITDLVGDLCVVRTAMLKNILTLLNREGGRATQSMIDENFFPSPSQKNSYEKGNTVYYRGGMDPNVSVHQVPMMEVNPAVFKMVEELKQEIDSIAGISRILDPRALNSNVSATAVTLVNSVAEQRQLMIVKNIASGLEKVFKQWLQLNSDLLQDTLVPVDGERVMVNDELIDLADNFTLDVTVGTTGQKQEQIASLNAMMQLLSGNGKPVPAYMLAEMARLTGHYKLGDELLNDEKVTIEQLQQQVEQLTGTLQQTAVRAQEEIVARDEVIGQLSNGEEMELKRAEIALKNAQAGKAQSDALKVQREAAAIPYASQDNLEVIV